MTEEKMTYVSPETETLVVRFEGVICGSPNGQFGENGNVKDTDTSGWGWGN